MMKPGVSPDTRRQVLELRRRHSLREVAERTGLPLGTVKTLCSRSGAFRDNEAHRALFSLPPIRHSSQTLPAVPELPPQRTVTGDKEVDAVIWLRQVIGTGQAALIEKAMQGAKKIKTPLKEVEKRYQAWLMKENPGSLFAALSSFDFANLEGLARKSVEKTARRHEALSRFGDAIFSDTDAESFCIGALAGLNAEGDFGDYDADKAATRFRAHPEVMPNTLSDCMYELSFWRELYRLRHAATPQGGYAPDFAPEANARDDFVFRSLAYIRPRHRDESIAVLRYLAEHDYMNRTETNEILSNLIR